MPTKPTPATRPRWNLDADNRSVPSAGKIDLGWEFGEAPSSAFFNWWMFEIGDAVDWVLDGSAAADADAHIVETDATGEVHVVQLEVVAEAAATYGIAVDAPATTVSAITATGGTGGNGVVGTGGASGGAGVRGVGGAGNGPGMSCLGNGTGAGISGVGGASGPGGDFTGGATSGNGVRATGTAAAAGVSSTGGPTNGTGVLGIAGGTSGLGVDGQSHASGTSSGVAVRGFASGDATGVQGRATDGYGVVAQSDLTSPTRSAMRVVPQDADPTTLADGDVWHNSTTDELCARIASGSRRLLWRTGGQCYAYSQSAGPTTDNTAVYTTALVASLGAPNAPPRTGNVRIKVTGEVGRVTSAAANIQLQLYDDTATAEITNRIVTLFQAAGTYERDISWETTYALPAAGARNISLRIRRSGGSDIVGIRNMTLTIDGVY